MHMQLDDPLDAIAVHAWNGTWGVIAVGLFAGDGLIAASYGQDPYTMTNRQYGCFLGGNGRLLGAQLIYAVWLGGPLPPLFLHTHTLHLCVSGTFMAKILFLIKILHIDCHPPCIASYHWGIACRPALSICKLLLRF
jgi:hypothetical protein